MLYRVRIFFIRWAELCQVYSFQNTSKRTLNQSHSIRAFSPRRTCDRWYYTGYFLHNYLSRHGPDVRRQLDTFNNPSDQTTGVTISRFPDSYCSLYRLFPRYAQNAVSKLELGSGDTWFLNRDPLKSLSVVAFATARPSAATDKTARLGRGSVRSNREERKHEALVGTWRRHAVFLCARRKNQEESRITTPSLWPQPTVHSERARTSCGLVSGGSAVICGSSICVAFRCAVALLCRGIRRLFPFAEVVVFVRRYVQPCSLGSRSFSLQVWSVCLAWTEPV